MAKKCEFNGLPAYEEGPFTMFKAPEDGLWHVYHTEANVSAMSVIKPFIQKKDALTYVLELCNTTIDWGFKSEEEMVKINSQQVLNSQLSPILQKRALK